MRKLFKKGNALVTTTVILFAVSILAAGLTTYFYYASIQTNNQNLYNNKHIELENQFNKNYGLILLNEQVTFDNSEEKNINGQIATLSNNATFTFTLNGYKNKVERIEDFDINTKAFKYSVETNYELRSGRIREYKLVKTLHLSSSEYSIVNSEGFYVTTI